MEHEIGAISTLIVPLGNVCVASIWRRFLWDNQNLHVNRRGTIGLPRNSKKYNRSKYPLCSPRINTARLFNTDAITESASVTPNCQKQ